jgi:hypothetical protein
MITRKQQQITAIRDLAKHSGRSVAEVAAQFGGATGLGAIEVAALAHEAAGQAEPMPPAERAEFNRAVETAEAKAGTKQAVNDVRAFRAYQATTKEDPFAAARMRLTHSSAIERGRALDHDPNDDGPKAA